MQDSSGEADRPATRIQIEDVGPCKKLLRIEVPPEAVDAELDKTYKQLSENIVVPGFRKGRVPRWLMQGKFGKQVNEDAKMNLMSESFDHAVKDKELSPIGDPKFDADVEFAPGKPLSFGVTIEVRPEFEIEDYTNLTLERASVEPTQAEIDERTDAVRRRYAKLEDITEGSPAPDDVVICHVVLTEGESTYRDIPNHQFIVGQHVLIGLTAEETTEFLAAATVGKTVEKEITLPDTYPDEAKRGAKMTLGLTIEKIRRPILPVVDEEWVKEVGFDSLEEFNEEVRTAVRREKERLSKNELQHQISEQLLAKADFDLPEDVVSRVARRSLLRYGLELRYYGVPAGEIDRNVEQLLAASRSAAEKEARLYFIMEKIADKERIFVTEEEVDARIEAIAANSGRSPEQVRREIESKDRLGQLRSTMREEKVRAFLLEKATIKEREPSAKETPQPEK